MHHRLFTIDIIPENLASSVRFEPDGRCDPELSLGFVGRTSLMRRCDLGTGGDHLAGERIILFSADGKDLRRYCLGFMSEIAIR